MLPEHLRHVRTGLVDRLDQAGDSRRHHEEVLGLCAPGIAERVRRPATREQRRSRPDLELVSSEEEPQRSSKHVPGLVIVVVDVQRCDPVVADLGRSLDDHEIVAQRSENVARQWVRQHGPRIADARSREVTRKTGSSTDTR